VRLSYAGRELPPSLDASLLELLPGIDTVAALQRPPPADTTLDPFRSRRRPSALQKRAAAQNLEPKLQGTAFSELVWAAASDDVKADRRRAAARQVPGSRQGCGAELQLARQFRDLLRNPIPGVSAAPSEDDCLLGT
jgi:hypothetical protein